MVLYGQDGFKTLLINEVLLNLVPKVWSPLHFDKRTAKMPNIFRLLKHASKLQRLHEL